MPRFVGLLCGKPLQVTTEQFSLNAYKSLVNWFSSEPGRCLLHREAELIGGYVRGFHGDSLLWLGPVPDAMASISRCMVKNQIYVCPEVLGRHFVEVPTMVTSSGMLPVASDSVDGVVLHHGLEYSVDPRSSICEVIRVLRPGGRVLICCFNPFSLWTIGQFSNGLKGLKSVSAFRLNDWLMVLGFKRDGSIRYLNYRSIFKLKFVRDRWRQVSAWLNEMQFPVGEVYMVVATKEMLERIRLVSRLARTNQNISSLTMPRPTVSQ